MAPPVPVVACHQRRDAGGQCSRRTQRDRLLPPKRQFPFWQLAANGIGYAGRMENPPISGFDIRINGIWRTFRDQQPAAYEAALMLRKKNSAAGVTITNTTTGVMVTMLEDGRTT